MRLDTTIEINTQQMRDIVDIDDVDNANNVVELINKIRYFKHNTFDKFMGKINFMDGRGEQDCKIYMWSDYRDNLFRYFSGYGYIYNNIQVFLCMGHPSIIGDRYAFFNSHGSTSWEGEDSDEFEHNIYKMKMLILEWCLLPKS